MSFSSVPMEQRFWSRVRVLGADDCWEWEGRRDRKGYGHISRPGHSAGSIGAHRYSAMLHFGMFDSRLMVCHRCDNPSCVNPAHLFLGTGKDNATDMSLKGRGKGQSLDSCPAGHPYDEVNTYYAANRPNSRKCRACNRDYVKGRHDAAYWREYRAKRKENGDPVKRRAQT